MNEIFNRREKRILVILLALSLAIVCGCKTSPGTVLSDNGQRDNETRDDLAAITSGQTELAITGTEITSGLNTLEQSIVLGTASNGGFEEIIRAVRNRPLDDN